MRLATTRWLMMLAVTAAFAETQFEKVRELNAQVLNLHGANEPAYAGQQPAWAVDAGSVFSLRLSALSDLIAQDPDQALRVAFPPDLLEELTAAFPEHRASLESYGEWQGPVDIFIRDGGGSTSIVRMKTANEDVGIHFGSGERPSLMSSDILSVSGLRARDQIAVDKAKIVSAVTGADSMAQCSTLGEQRIAVILPNFKNSRLPADVDTNRVRSILLGDSGSVDDFWRKNSDGMTWVKRTGTGALAVDRAVRFGTGLRLRRRLVDRPEAATKAAEGNLNLEDFSRVLVFSQRTARAVLRSPRWGVPTEAIPGDPSTPIASRIWRMA